MVKKLAIKVDNGSGFNSEILSGPKADKGGYNVQPPVANCDKLLMIIVKETISVKPLMTITQ